MFLLSLKLLRLTSKVDLGSVNFCSSSVHCWAELLCISDENKMKISDLEEDILEGFQTSFQNEFFGLERTHFLGVVQKQNCKEKLIAIVVFP